MPSTTPLPTAPLLDVRHLAKRYGTRQAVADVSLQVAPGTLLGLLGPNGAGKSTTLSMIAGLTPADSGSVHIAGRSQADDPAAARRQIGLVTQDLACTTCRARAATCCWSARCTACAARRWRSAPMQCWPRWAWPTAPVMRRPPSAAA